MYLITGWQEPNWADKAAEEFVEDSIDIEEEEEKTGVINLTVYGESPRKLAAKIANGMADLLEQRTAGVLAAKGGDCVYQVVAKQVERSRGEPHEARRRPWSASRRQKDLYGPDENRRLLVQRIDQLRTDLRARAGCRGSWLRARVREPGPEPVPAGEHRPEPRDQADRGEPW